MYFMSYKFVFHLMITVSKQQLFLKLMYKSISQPCFKYKLLKFPSDCDLETELSPILLDLYQRNTDLEFRDYKFTRKGILKNISLSTKKTVTFDLLPIDNEEKKMDCCRSPLRRFLHLKLHLHLIDPRHPEK